MYVVDFIIENNIEIKYGSIENFLEGGGIEWTPEFVKANIRIRETPLLYEHIEELGLKKADLLLGKNAVTEENIKKACRMSVRELIEYLKKKR